MNTSTYTLTINTNYNTSKSVKKVEIQSGYMIRKEKNINLKVCIQIIKMVLILKRHQIYSMVDNVHTAYTSSGAGGVRPSVSLKNEIIIKDGDGTSENPFIIVEKKKLIDLAFFLYITKKLFVLNTNL